MAIGTDVWHLVSYDIASPRRWRVIYKYLKFHGIPIQYSVFLVHCSPVKMDEHFEYLAEYVDEDEDDLRIYMLPRKPDVITLGSQGLEEGLHLLGDPGSYGVIL